MIKRFFAQEWVAWVFMITCMVLAIVFGWKQKPKMINDKSGMLTQDTIEYITRQTEQWNKKYKADYAIYITADDSKLEKHAKKEASKLKIGEDDLMIAVSLAGGDVCLGNDDEFFSLEGLFRDELSDAYFDDDIDAINAEIIEVVDSVDANLRIKDKADEDEGKPVKGGIDAFSEGVAEFAGSTVDIVKGTVGWGLGLAGKILSKLAKLGFWGIVIVFIIISSIFGKKK